MKASYYPGCSLEGTAKSYDHSSRAVCKALGIDLEDIPDWSCCGSSPALKMNKDLSTALAAHNLALSETQSVEDVVIPCPFCFRRLLSAQAELAADPDLKARIETAVEAEIRGTTGVHSLLGFISDRMGAESVKEKVRHPLKGLKVAPYYGCYLVKPHGVTGFDDPENPTSMDDLLTALGAEVVDWDFKTECCGAGLAVSKTETVRDLCRRIVAEAAHQKADAVVVACQLCQANLDMRQEKGAMPILYFTQLMGLAFGMSAKDLGLKHHLANPMKMLKAKGIVS
jgi:heterodisulfide reductase subunit B